MPPVRILEPRDDVLARGVQYQVGADVQRGLGPDRRGLGDVYRGGARSPDRLDAEQAYGAGAQHGHLVPQLDVGVADGPDGDGARLAERCCLVGYAVRDRQGLPVFHDDVLGVAPQGARGEADLAVLVAGIGGEGQSGAGRGSTAAPDHPVADLPAGDVRAYAGYGAAVLVAQDDAGRHLVVEEGVHVGAADGAVLDLELDLVGARLGGGDILDVELPVARVYRCSHRLTPHVRAVWGRAAVPLKTLCAPLDTRR